MNLLIKIFAWALIVAIFAAVMIGLGVVAMTDPLR